MAYSLKQTCILITSIIAMLVSSHVSSMPMMNSSMSMSGSLSQEVSHQSAQNTSEVKASHPQHATMDCHSAKTQSMADDGLSHSDCCQSMCSGAFYPLTLTPTNSVSTAVSILVLHQSLKIGAKVTRIQNIFRPPSA